MILNLRNRWLYYRRAKVYDASSEVEWVNTTMYDREEKVDAYDTASGEKLSTFNSVIELEFLDMIDAFDIKSVLDVGCGAGAFYHLLSSAKPGVKYFVSHAQIARANARFGDLFGVRDISTISGAEFSCYDAIHVYSVFSFMSVPNQIAVLRRMLTSGAKCLLDTGCTLPDIHYAPRSCFKDFSKTTDVDGKSLMTTISFPFRSELERVVRGTGHAIAFRETAYGATRAINNSDRAGGALADKKAIKRKRPECSVAIFPEQRGLKLLMARIAPHGWKPQRAYSLDEISAIISNSVF